MPRTGIRGNVDHIAANVISGWAYDPDDPQPIEIRAMLDGKAIGTALAREPRPDVAHVLNTSGLHGFTIRLATPLADQQRNAVRVEAKSKVLGGAKTAVQRPAAGAYQSFGDAKGSSKSAAKLKALQLNQLPNRSSDRENPLNGLSVLDLGCNEGFFVDEARRQGARRAVGIDADKGIIERARQRFPDSEFIATSWWELPNEKFDVILFLSAIHYEPEQRKLLDMLATHLTPTGVLVLECGVGPGNFSGDRTWHNVARWDGVRRYPSFELLTSELLDAYASRWLGPSVRQDGDPVPRQVFHCSLRLPSVILLAGPSGSGKTVLMRQLASKSVQSFQIDWLLTRIITEERYAWSPLYKALAKFRAPGGIRLDYVAKFIVDEQLTNDFIEVFLQEVPLESRLLLVEGEILSYPAVRTKLIDRFTKNHIKSWVLTPG
jgi:SAM-dependent methyltransferase